MSPKNTMANDDEIPNLQIKWKEMFQHRLPEAATSHSPAQHRWPVHVDHCFARIILDEVVGGGKEPWLGKVKSPAYKNMSREQLEKAIEIGEGILDGKVDLVAMDESSLRCRGKAGKGKGQDRGKKLLDGEKKADEDTKSRYFASEETLGEKRKQQPDETPSSPPSKKPKTSAVKAESPRTKQSTASHSSTRSPSPSTDSLLKKISHSSKTQFQKHVLALLLQIPPGRYSTYGALSRHLDSSPRAVGNALRNNPFAPEVPCHRILATGGGLGGFGGSWGGKGKFKGKEGENDGEKLRLLRSEGVRFDGKGRVVGGVWEDFT